MSFMCRNGHLHSKQYLAEDCATCRRLSRKAAPIVPGPAKDDGRGRISAYDTTWPDMHDRQSGGHQQLNDRS